MGDKIESNKTVYPTGMPMFTPIDPLMHKGFVKVEQFERDHVKFHSQFRGAEPDPLLHGPYAFPHPEPGPKPGPKPLPGPRVTKLNGQLPSSRSVQSQVPQAESPKQPAQGQPWQTPPARKESTSTSTTPPPAADPHGISRPLYTGGAPALRPDQMDAAVVDGNLILKTLYALPARFSFLTTGYMAITRVLGPVGAVVNLGYNVVNARHILSDREAPGVLKAGIVASTGLAAVSAGTAGALAASTVGWLPMATPTLKSVGHLCGVTGLGAGALLSAMDTFNTFRDPHSTSAEKGFSTLTTVASVALTTCVLFGVTGSAGIVLGLGAIGFTLAKGLLGHSKWANDAFGAVGHFAEKLKFW